MILDVDEERSVRAVVELVSSNSAKSLFRRVSIAYTIGFGRHVVATVYRAQLLALTGVVKLWAMDYPAT